MNKRVLILDGNLKEGWLHNQLYVSVCDHGELVLLNADLLPKNLHFVEDEYDKVALNCFSGHQLCYRKDGS